MLSPKQRVSLALSSLLVSSQVYAIDVSYQSHIKPSAVALDALRHKGNNTPKIKESSNGISVIDIADANNAGISNNYFTDFNVGKEGLIFNNSKDLFVNTTLAGYINGNSNLSNEASLILTQVTGSNPSSLLGVMEIAGKRADLIIANPNGITCNGCGVLNAKSFTLSTGVISQEEINRVDHINELNKTLTMMTQRGHINIEALNTSNTAKLNIIAKSALVSGNLIANDLQLILGENKVFFDLSNKSDASLLLYEAITTKNAKGEEQKALALDVTHLGSVVANSIYLIATDEGVGVRNSGTLATTGSKIKGDGGFVIDVNGIVTISAPENAKSTLDQESISPTLSSSANLEIRAKELHNGSIISANTDVNITAEKVENISRYEIKDVVTNYTEGSWYEKGKWFKIFDKRWKVEEQVQNYSPAIIQVGNNLTITAGSITNDMGNLNATNEAVFKTKESFINKAPELKVKVYRHHYKRRNIDVKIIDTYYEGLESSWYAQNNLPQYNLQNLLLCNQEKILSNALIFASTPNYTQESREEYVSLSSYLASDSYKEYVKSHYHRDPNYSNALLQKEIELAVLKETYRQQNTQALNSAFENLERRLQEIKEAKQNIDPNTLTSAGMSAESVKIEGGEITNSALIEAGYIAIIGDKVFNENGEITSRGDLNIQAGDFKNFGADLIAGNDLTINADNVEIGTIHFKTSDLGGVGNKTSDLFGNNITITSNSDATFTSVNMEANNNLSINAKDNVLFDTAQNISITQTSSSKTKIGWFKTTKTTITTTTTTKTNIANSLKGNNISISAGNDLKGFNIKTDAKENLALNAGGDLTLSTKADERNIYEEKEETTVGIFIHKDSTPIRKTGGISIGEQTINTDTNTTITTHNNQTLGANNISLKAGNKATLESIDTDSKNISINAKDVSITAKEDKFEQTIHKDTTTKTFGIGGSVNTNAWGVNVGVGYEERKVVYDKNTQNTSTSSANINANNITITTADKQGNPQGDINIIGSNLNGSEIALSGKNVNIKAHQTTSKTIEREKTTISHRGGLNILGLGGGNFITTGGMYGVVESIAGINPQDQNNSFSQSITHTASNLSGNKINITTKNAKGNTQGNINITGSNLSAKSETNLTATNVNIKGSQDLHIQGGYGFGYDVLISAINLPSLLDAEAYTKANANAFLNTKVNNSSITSNTINITSSYTPKKVIEGSKVDWDLNKIFKNQDKIKKSGKKLYDSWLALQEAKEGNGDLKKAQNKFRNTLVGFGTSLILNTNIKILQCKQWQYHHCRR
ncbi:hypothetical protein HpCK38_14600 [Helicobacter pylori]